MIEMAEGKHQPTSTSLSYLSLHLFGSSGLNGLFAGTEVSYLNRQKAEPAVCQRNDW